MSKPPFNPNQPFEVIEKPPFDPSKPFEAVDIPSVKTKPSTNSLEALGRGFSQGATFGLQDELEGAMGSIQRGGNYLLGNTKDKDILDALRTGYLTDRDAARAYDAKLTAEHPVSSFAGQVASGLPSMAAKGAFTIPSMVAQGALSGFGNARGDMLDQAGSASAGGLIAGGLGKATEVIAPKVAQGVSSLKTNLGLIGLGANKKAVTSMGENAPEVVQAAIQNGSMNPFRTIPSQIAANEKVLQSSGQQLGAVRETLPPVLTKDILDKVSSRSSKLEAGLDDSALSQIEKLKDVIQKKSSNEGTMALDDLVSLKGKIGQSSRTAFGDLTKNKEGMDVVRQALRDVEIDSASKLAPEYKNFLKKSSTAHTVAELLSNKDATDKASSLISLGGMIGGAGYAAGSQDPKGLLLAALFSKTGRDRLARSGAVSIDAVQKLATKLEIDPKVVAYLLSRQNAGEK